MKEAQCMVDEEEIVSGSSCQHVMRSSDK